MDLMIVVRYGKTGARDDEREREGNHRERAGSHHGNLSITLTV
jgi:hypothetical protein